MCILAWLMPLALQRRHIRRIQTSPRDDVNDAGLHEKALYFAL